uniref:Inactive purple acid phosphatase-like protein n=1 Tax=Glycine max TaxID=3847 RepID=A0A0R0K2I4_SOYBN
MAASSRGFSTTQFDFKLRVMRLNAALLPKSHVLEFGPRKRRKLCFDSDRVRLGDGAMRCCCSDSVTPIRRTSGPGNGSDKNEEWRFDTKKPPHIHRVRVQASPAAMPFASPPSFLKQEKFFPRCTPRNSGPQSRDTPPKRGVEKSGRNSEGDTWWETWQENLHQDEWSNIARIERSAQKQAKSGTENAGWYEKWWEKYDAKGWTEKGAHKYGRLNEQSWWEKWGEHYDGRGSVLKWTDKWAETELGTKWGDKWEERFFKGIGSRHGETWHVSPSSERWSRTWGEEHFGNGKVHKYGNSTTGESWDIVVDEETYYEAEPHYGWADVVGDSTQLLSIEPRERPPGVFPNLDFGSPPSPEAHDDSPDEDFPSSQ